VTVYSLDGSRKVVRERSGGHRGLGPTVGHAVEDCIKAAETDATKRAFVTFGNIFGLALYDREQRNVGTPEVATHRRQGSVPPLAPIDEGFEQAQQPRRQSVSAPWLCLPGHPPMVGTARQCPTDPFDPRNHHVRVQAHRRADRRRHPCPDQQYAAQPDQGRAVAVPSSSAALHAALHAATAASHSARCLAGAS